MNAHVYRRPVDTDFGVAALGVLSATVRVDSPGAGVGGKSAHGGGTLAA